MTTNSEWLNELAKSDPKALQAWFDAEHVDGTNGDGDGTNGIADGSPLVDELGEITHEVSELMKKQPYTFDVNDVQGSIRLAGRYIDELTAERDEWKAKAEHYGGHVDRLMEAIRDLARKQPRTFDPEAPYKNAELVGKYIDELEAKAEIAERAMNAAAGKWARADARSAERAAAVERLRNCLYTSDSDLMRAMLNWGHEPHTGDDSRFALIDLLTDEPMNAQPDGNGTCPDGNGTASNRNPFYAVADALGVNCADRTDERIAERMLEVLTDDWMELPKDKYDEVIHLEDVMTAPGEDCWTVLAVNEGGFLTFHEDGSYHMRSCRDWQHTLGPVDAQSKTEPKLTEQSESLSDETDSREKLEADIEKRAVHAETILGPLRIGTVKVGTNVIHGWLDRQVEITKREWAHVNDMYIADVRAERDAAESRAAELEAEIAKRDKGIARLKRQRDEARADLEAFAGMPSTLEPMEQERTVNRLQRENIELARDLTECSREREAYRRACGELLDLADQMRLVRLDGCGAALVDEQGEVVP